MFGAPPLIWGGAFLWMCRILEGHFLIISHEYHQTLKNKLEKYLKKKGNISSRPV